MDAVGLGIAVLGLCADLRVRLESIRSAPRVATSMRSRINNTEGCLARVVNALNCSPPSLTMETGAHESLCRLEASLQDLSATTKKLHEDLHGTSWRRLRSRIPFALDTTKMENYERILDRLVADITAFTSTANLQQLSLMTEQFRSLQILSSNPAVPENIQDRGFELGFYLSNVPTIHHFEGRESFLQRLSSTLLPAASCGQRKLEIVSGLGGIGKTQLVIRFARINEKQFSSIFFIDAYSQESISHCFRDVHFLLFGHDNKHASGVGNEESTQDGSHMIREVLAWFCLNGNDKWLLIFDNVDRQPSDPGGVDMASFFPPSNKGSILITTRLFPLEVSGISQPQIVLEPMDKQESRNLLGYHTNRYVSPGEPSNAYGTTDEQDALVARLAGLPLALAQAGSFLDTTRMNIPQYLELYDSSRRRLLESHRPMFGHNDSLRSGVETTWRMSIDLLSDMAREEDSRYGDALQLLRFITYFEPTDIDFAILRRGLVSEQVPPWFERTFGDELAFVNTAQILVERSLLNNTSTFGIYSMHRVVYDWLCAFETAEPDEQLLRLAVCAVAFSAPGRLCRSWKDNEKRLYIHALAMEDRLLRCKFESGSPMADLEALRTPQKQQALHLVRDPNWFGYLRGVQEPLSILAYLFSVSEKSQTGLEILHSALSRSQQVANLNDLQNISALLLGKAIILIHQKNLTDARQCVDSVLELASPYELHYILREVDLLHAILSRLEGRPGEAVQILKDCLDQCKRHGFGLYHPSTYTVSMELNVALDKGTDHVDLGVDIVSEKIRLLEPYRSTAEKNASHDADARVILGYLGEAYRLANAPSESLAVLQAGLTAELANGGGSVSNLDDMYYDLFRVYSDACDFPKAIEACENWVRVRETHYGTKATKTAYALSDLCCVLGSSDSISPRAVQVGLQAAEVIDPNDKREYWRLCQRLRTAYELVENQQEALIWALKAAEGFEAEFGSQLKAQHAEDLQAVALLYEKLGDPVAAGVYNSKHSAWLQEA